MTTFDAAWRVLAKRGKCDAIGSVEYTRIKEAWESQGEMLSVLNYIINSANQPPEPPSPPATTKGDEQ